MTLDELPWEKNEAFFPETYRIARWRRHGTQVGFIENFLDKSDSYRIVFHKWERPNREGLDPLTAQCLVHQILSELEKST
jgi:hypothetical protein